MLERLSGRGTRRSGRLTVAVSTMRPCSITSTRWQKRSTSRRSWVMNRHGVKLRPQTLQQGDNLRPQQQVEI